MGIDTIKANIKTALESVTGIDNNQGVVYDYIRDWKGSKREFLKIFVATAVKRINSWEITRVSSTETEHAIAAGGNKKVLRRHNIMILGKYSAKDSIASEKTFQSLIEAVSDALRLETKQPNLLSNAAHRMGLPQVTRVDRRAFSIFQIHACELTFWVEELLTV